MKISHVSQRLAGGDGGGWAVHDKGVALQAAGQDVILLSVGDPDFPTPEPIFYEALAAMKHDRTHYSPAQGEPALRAAIAALETQTSDHPCDPDEIVVFPGATNAIYAVLSCLVNPGDEILVPEPTLRSSSRRCGPRSRPIPASCWSTRQATPAATSSGASSWPSWRRSAASARSGWCATKSIP
jgi:bifunctional pyridoxal-dependent enzyme with beta-cystathionase and maltose regulon repressor activities